MNPAPTFAAAAADLARVGWRVHPLRPRSKLPLLTAWPERATSDAATVEAWWADTPASNVGIATGAGVFVLDVDSANGKSGAESLAALEAVHGPLPATLEATTASGGRHLYFASAGPVRNSAGKLGAGLDVRGAGGYVVAAPSVTDRGAYRWARLAPVAPAPAWLVRLAMDAAPTASAAPAIHASVEAAPELLDDLRSALAALPADNRTDWIAVGAALRPLGDVGRDLWTAWSTTSPKHDPQRDPDTWETIGFDTTGPAAVFARAQRAGWINPRSTLATAARVLAGGDATCMEPRSALQPVAVDDVLSAFVPPPRFVVDPLIPAGHVTLFGSHGGAGKSLLALTLAAHVAAGVPWAGRPVMHCRVLFVSLEDAGAIVRYRLRKIVEAYGLDVRTVAAGLRVLDGSEGNAALMAETASFGLRTLAPTATLAELRATVGDSGLVIVDNASDAFDGQENDRRQVRTFIRALAALGPAVLLLAHIDKAAARFGSAGQSFSGSTAWHNSARSRLALITDRAGPSLVQEKLNLGRAAEPIRLEWSAAGVLVPAGIDGTVADSQAQADAAAVLLALEAAAHDGVNVPTARSGPATAQRVLESLPDLPAHLRGPRGREDFWAAVAALQRSERIGTEEFLNESRHRREKFVVRQCASSAPVMEPTQTGEPVQGTRASAPVPAQGVRGIDARADPALATGAAAAT